MFISIAISQWQCTVSSLYIPNYHYHLLAEKGIATRQLYQAVGAFVVSFQVPQSGMDRTCILHS